MGFMDNLKRSLGYEEEELNNGNNNSDALSNLSDMFNNLVKPKDGPNHQQQQNTYQQYRSEPRRTPTPNPRPAPTPVYDDYDDDYVIIPEHSFYEIVLIRPKTIDDINYVVDQVIEENNPVILDLSFLEKESAANFKLAGDKIKQMRERYGVQALLLARTEDKDLLIVSPKKVKVINKG
ncbi:cell division protein SepF [uncultured Methanobrevibacter sp.]|uniref:cell division protein SepF n=1 Tax=uncultured Methanobrevibacter sp. TaxID=253161 RepID=UPI0025D11FC6|nr:cell division protein SepF [uncultured Methanobrevibacter sp.]